MSEPIETHHVEKVTTRDASGVVSVVFEIDNVVSTADQVHALLARIKTDKIKVTSHETKLGVST